MSQASPKSGSRSLYFTYLLAGAVSVLFACANPIPPSGGPKDTTPPTLVTEESTPNFLTNFDRSEITLTFDEWIQLKDQNQQIVISPPLLHRPEITLRGKSIIIKFDERDTLHPRTTYTINFGSAIADITESNVAEQFKYIFSTGTYIDSLSLAGTIISTPDNAPAKDVLILLYDDLSDTAFASVLPAYFTKSDKAGNWQIENIRSDTFRLYALIDQNLNYRYDQQGESIGFLGHTVVLPDTLQPYQLTLFQEEPVISVLNEIRKTPGVTKILLTGESDAITVSAVSQQMPIFWDIAKDTVFVWNPSPDSLPFAIFDNHRAIDTLVANGFSGGAPSVRFTTAMRTFSPLQAFEFISATPLARVDTSRLYAVLGDSAEIRNLSIVVDSVHHRTVSVMTPWKELGAYRLVIPAGTVTDIFGTPNDTIRFLFQVNKLSSYGQIFLQVDSLDDQQDYVVQLRLEQGKLVEQQTISHLSGAKLSFPGLSPQRYFIRIIEDTNGNGRWDTGNFAQHRQPERVLNQTLEPLRQDWDLEATITWQKKHN